MDAIEAIKTRRSIRQYRDEPIPKNVLEAIVDTGRCAPTARGVEPWHFIIITAAEALKTIGEIADHGRFIAQAAACVVIFCEDTKYYLEDGSAATQNIMVAARAHGVGSCWVAGDKKPYCSQVARFLGAPGGFRLVSMVALGYPCSEGEFKEKDKRPLSERVHWERYRGESHE